MGASALGGVTAMSAAIIFDTHAYVKKLRDAGVDSDVRLENCI